MSLNSSLDTSYQVLRRIRTRRLCSLLTGSTIENKVLIKMTALSVMIVKTILIVVIVITFLVVLPAVPVGIKAIDDLERHPDHKNSMTTEQAGGAKIILTVLTVLELIFLLFELIGAIKKNFLLTLVGAICLSLMSLGLMFALRTNLDVIVLVFNVLVATVGVIFAILVKTHASDAPRDEWELS